MSNESYICEQYSPIYRPAVFGLNFLQCFLWGRVIIEKKQFSAKFANHPQIALEIWKNTCRFQVSIFYEVSVSKFVKNLKKKPRKYVILSNFCMGTTLRAKNYKLKIPINSIKTY
jgi:hypothetical protein